MAARPRRLSKRKAGRPTAQAAADSPKPHGDKLRNAVSKAAQRSSAKKR